MDMLKSIKTFLREITEVGLLLLALGIVAGVMAGTNVPFLGNVVDNITSLVRSLGENGLVGLMSLGVIAWLFTKK